MLSQQMSFKEPGQSDLKKGGGGNTLPYYPYLHDHFVIKLFVGLYANILYFPFLNYYSINYSASVIAFKMKHSRLQH